MNGAAPVLLTTVVVVVVLVVTVVVYVVLPFFVVDVVTGDPTTGSAAVVVVVGLLVLLVEINIARLIMTLNPWQIAIFLIAQLVGAGLAWLFIASVFLPVPPDSVAQ